MNRSEVQLYRSTEVNLKSSSEGGKKQVLKKTQSMITCFKKYISNRQNSYLRYNFKIMKKYSWRPIIQDSGLRRVGLAHKELKGTLMFCFLNSVADRTALCGPACCAQHGTRRCHSCGYSLRNWKYGYGEMTCVCFIAIL